MADIEQLYRGLFRLIRCEKPFLCVAFSVAGSSDVQAVRTQIQRIPFGLDIQQLSGEVRIQGVTGSKPLHRPKT